MATPEYMPPEVLELIQNYAKYTNFEKSQVDILNELSNSWSVDVWSLGSILLEILTGIPHWLSYKCQA
jgi:serine/threonine protein kinase